MIQIHRGGVVIDPFRVATGFLGVTDRLRELRDIITNSFFWVQAVHSVFTDQAAPEWRASAGKLSSGRPHSPQFLIGVPTGSEDLFAP